MATSLKVFAVHRSSALEHLGMFVFVDDALDPSAHGFFRAFAGPICPWLLQVSVQWLQGSQQVVPVAVMSGSAAASDLTGPLAKRWFGIQKPRRLPGL
jgi:hypothetical protein